MVLLSIASMASKAIKRRPCSSETDKSSEKQMETTISHPVTEPLLENGPHEDKSKYALSFIYLKRYEPATWSDFWDGTRQECLRWAHLLSIFIAQSAKKDRQCFLGFHCFTLQVERLRLLRQRLDVPYDCSSVKHQDSFHRLLHKVEGKRAEWEYPFAAGGVNISYMLVQMLDLQSDDYLFVGKMSTKAAVHSVQLLEDDETAFDNLFYVAFQVLDSQWLARRANYMEFNVSIGEVLKSTRVELENELTTRCISSVQDLSSFRMLKR
ncbi:hypothetical protein HU200_066584 [Digitaria exilis]|uniref:ELMO domain-containing protein n=1 Tax=Digitaria exilis TaxID=1010633 RepID=A0A835A0V2_9POAL|nr:hypothetical protein HU200_066584 [Digitaria exilis]